MAKYRLADDFLTICKGDGERPFHGWNQSCLFKSRSHIISRKCLGFICFLVKHHIITPRFPERFRDNRARLFKRMNIFTGFKNNNFFQIFIFISGKYVLRPEEFLGVRSEQQWQGDNYEGKTVFENVELGSRVKGHRPEEDDYAHPNLGEDEITGTVSAGEYIAGIHTKWMFYLARICNHCTYPACLAACPRKAIYKRDEDGIVLVDESRCRGYQECVKACPYKKIFYNAMTRTSEKCIGCYPRVEQGLQPRCVESCIGKIRLQGWLSKPGEAKADNPIDQLVHIKKIALPLYPQYGTEPNVYYIPPIHVPRNFLTQMFGPGVEVAIKNYLAAKEDMEALAAMLMFGNTPQIITKYKYNSTHATGYNEKGEEVVKVPVTEPFVVRRHYDEKYKAYRLNTA